jgi:hypothetical protein
VGPILHLNASPSFNLTLIFTLVIENKGYGALIHDTKSIYARSKCSSKGTAFVLLFFISKSQCVYFKYFQQFLWGKPVLFKGMQFLGFGPIPMGLFSLNYSTL